MQQKFENKLNTNKEEFQKVSKVKVFFSEIKSLFYVVLFALLVRIIAFEPFFVPTGSMEDSIRVGDYVFATKYNYGYSKYSMPFAPNLFNGRILDVNQPKRGDIIVFFVPERGIRYIKRLIGLPGDEIQMIDGFLYINGKQVQKEYLHDIENDGLKFKKYKETLPNGVQHNVLSLDASNKNLDLRYKDTKIFKVPQGKLFFMGDNRDLSGDSRSELSYVPIENLIAKARFVYFSTDEMLFDGDLSVLDQFKRVYTWIKSIRFKRIFKSLDKYEQE